MTLGTRHFLYHFHFATVRERVCCASALIATALSSTLLLCAVFAEPHQDLNLPAQSSLPTDARYYVSFLDSRFDFYFSLETYSKIRPLPEDYRQLTATLLPLIPRQVVAPAPAERSPASVQHSAFTRQNGQRAVQSAALDASTPNGAAPENSTSGSAFQKFFAKLFGKLPASSVKLASAATDDSQLDAISITSRFDQWTAVYDISARTVYMPDGSKLEAHSGFDTSLDDPSRVDEKDRGPTPPNIYDLELREQPFHRVRALRLIPKDNQKNLGRTGLLAHNFLLGPNGQSNGCVSFRDYDAFLHAYLNHQVKRLVVVARLD
jgi:Protein of unknown function (DUF2778)